MFSFSFTKKDIGDKIFLIFDIGSSSVGGALIKIKSNGKPKILYSVRRQTIPQSVLNSSKLVSFMNRSLLEVIDEIKKRHFSCLSFHKQNEERTIDGIFCFLSSPWCISQARILNFKKKNSFVISDDFIKEIIDNEEKAFKISHLALYSKKLEDMDIIEKKITDIKIDGYRINNPYLKKTKEAEVSLFVSMASKEIIGKIKDIISSAFLIDGDIELNSFSLPAFSTVRDLKISEDDFIFVDAGGEITDILIVNEGVPKEAFSFPIGKNSLVREIQDAFNTNFQGALSMLNIYKEKKINTNISLRVENALKNIEDQWSLVLQNFLSHLSEKYFIPKNVFITADNDVAYWFAKFFSSDTLTNTGFSKDYFSTIFINTDTLDDFCDFDKIHNDDPFLITETIFLDKLFKHI